MNEREDSRWQDWLSLSGPTFAGKSEPPYGFLTSTLARVRLETRQQELMERIGMRALFASLAMLLITAGLTFSVDYLNGSDLEPGLKGMVQLENVQVS